MKIVDVTVCDCGELRYIDRFLSAITIYQFHSNGFITGQRYMFDDYFTRLTTMLCDIFQIPVSKIQYVL